MYFITRFKMEQFTQEELETEIWKDIPDFEGLYQVSNIGRIRSLDRIVPTKVGYKTIKGSILKLQNSGDYRKIELYKNGEYKRCAIHRLVMLAFEGDSDLVVDHIDENPSNNRLTNLRYLTHRDNISRGMKNKTSNYTGVYWDKTKEKWRAHLRVDTKGYSLGCFNDEEKALEVYKTALDNYLNDGTIPDKVYRCPPIICSETGKRYLVAKEAALDKGIEYKKLTKMLKGTIKNTSTLSYIIED